ncbi:MAG: PorV/PorQ family protein [candidate division Zixibacteria bacterium]|nr:PorV/PorQ family protein [candidate division Zixibacteria bacterium]
MSKRRVNRILIMWIALIGIVALIGRVSVAAPNAGRTAADFLQIGIGARAASLGGAFSALAEGGDAAWWNPAGLARLDYNQFSVGHFMWYQDITVENGAVAFSLSSRVSMAASLTFVDYGKIDGFDQNGNATGNLSASDWSGGLSVGAALTDQVSAGLTARFISQKLADISATGVSADFGLAVRLEKFRFAAVAGNIGPTMKFESQSERLPASFRLGAAYAPVRSAVAASAELEKKVYGDLVARQGIELRFADQYFLRSGLVLYPGQSGAGAVRAGYTAGAGLVINRVAIDYAFTPSTTMVSDDLHRFSLGFRF